MRVGPAGDDEIEPALASGAAVEVAPGLTPPQQLARLLHRQRQRILVIPCPSEKPSA